MDTIVDNPWLLFGFVSLFHIVGASVLASTLRAFWRGLRQGEMRGCRFVFTVVWAVMFSGIPFMLGVEFAASEQGSSWFLLAQSAVWTVTFVTVLLAEEVLKEALQSFRRPEMSLMIVGGGFLLLGVAMIAFVRGEGRLGNALIGTLFAVVGGGIFGVGLWKLLEITG